MRLLFTVLVLSLSRSEFVHSFKTSPKNTSSTCAHLKQSFHPDVILPGETEYDHLREVNWSPVTWKKPACIAIATNTTRVQQLVKLLVKDHVKFAIRSGGHNIAPGAGNIDDGVLIDMSGIKQTAYDPVNRIATVSPGLRWRDVHSLVSRYNATVVAGRILDVGVGGLTLGGGISYLSDKHGLACDNVVNFEVVLANGAVVNANSTSHQDLFWALKGGGNNFGIVTRLDIQAYPIQRVWGGYRIYAGDKLSDLVDAYARYQANVSDPDANLILQVPLTNLTNAGIILNMIYLRPVEEPAAFEPFRGVTPLLDNTKLQTYEELLGGAPLPNLPRWDFRASTFPVNGTLHHNIMNVTLGAPELKSFSNITGGTLVFSFQPISPNVALHGKAKGGNALGIPEAAQTWGAFATGWWNGIDDIRAHDLTKTLAARMEGAVPSSERLSFRFMNDASRDQDVIGSYGTENVARLKKVQARYDPHGVFHQLVPGGFKLPVWQG